MYSYVKCTHTHFVSCITALMSCENFVGIFFYFFDSGWDDAGAHC